MPWLELRCNTSEDAAEAIEELLFGLGAVSVTLTDGADTPIYEPLPGGIQVWPEITLIGLFKTDAQTEQIESCVTSVFSGTAQDWRWNQLEDRVWEREWLQHFKPMLFGDRLWVYHELIADSPHATLLLDPGLAFGTGTHPTTALCLEWITQQDWSNKQVIDFGCGSGVLALAALKLGATFAQCIDIDVQALIATKQNAQRNDLPDTLYSLCQGEADAQIQPDILFANILAGPLVRLAPKLISSLQSGGLICLSGILREQAQEVAQAYNPYFDNLEICAQDDWVRITGTRNQKSYD